MPQKSLRCLEHEVFLSTVVELMEVMSLRGKAGVRKAMFHLCLVPVFEFPQCRCSNIFLFAEGL